MVVQLKHFKSQEKITARFILRLNLIIGGLIFSSFLFWSVPPFVLSKERLSHRWIQGFCLAVAMLNSTTALILGYKLQKLEPIFKVQKQQEDEDFLHWLASSRYYSEAAREAAIEAAFQNNSEQLQEIAIATIPPLPEVPSYSLTASTKIPLAEFSQPQLDLKFQKQEEKEPTSSFKMPTPDDERVQELWKKIQESKNEWLLQLLLTKPLLIWGEQCSGKTKFAGFLALLRILFFSHKVSVSDPHSHQNSWPNIFEVYGREYNYNQINNRLIAYYERLKNATTPHTSIWDEVTQYQENCDAKLAGRFLKSILSDVRKPPEFPILLSHSNTLGSLGGGRGGTKKMQMRGLVEMNLRAKRDRLGNLIPALQGTITGLNLDERGEALTQPIELETWMQPDYLYEQFPQLNL